MEDKEKSYELRNIYQMDLWYWLVRRYQEKHSVRFQTKNPGYVVEFSLGIKTNDKGREYENTLWLHDNVNPYLLWKKSHTDLIRFFISRIKETLNTPLDDMKSGRGYLL